MQGSVNVSGQGKVYGTVAGVVTGSITGTYDIKDEEDEQEKGSSKA